MTKADITFALQVARFLVALPFGLLAIAAFALSALFMAGTLWLAASREEAKRFIHDVWEIGA